MGGKEATPPPDLVVVNAGNTHVRLVGYLGNEVVSDVRVPTARALAGEPLPLWPAVPVALVSVVPDITRLLEGLLGDREVKLVSVATAVGLTIAYQPPTALGADRLANAYALYQRAGMGLAVDFGTATTLTLVDPQGVLVGGAILPGLATAMASLARGTAQLPEVLLEAVPGAWGASTAESIRLGIVHGTVGAVQHLVGRMNAALERPVGVTITGGWAGLLAPLLPADYVHDPLLTIAGARAVYHCSTRASGDTSPGL